MDIMNIGNEYSHYAINLIGVIILILALMLILKKLKSAQGTDYKNIKVLNTVSLGAKERIILIEANNQLLLIGATPNHISTLHVFNNEEEIKPLPDQDSDLINSFSRHIVKEAE